MKMPEQYSVLVVDDEPSVLLTYRLILEQKGYDVAAVDSSREAMATLKRRNFDVLLCDLSLEEKQSGFDVIDFAFTCQPEIRVALLTGYASRDVADRALLKGIVVLFKPIEIDEFLQSIAKLAKERYDKAGTSGG